jgi:hypothetical protein
VPASVEPCYTGAPGTEDVGICIGGLRTCNAEGTGFGACEGEITPQGETCIQPLDEDCDGQINEEGPGCSCIPDATYDCYDGPPDTADVGACVTGSQVCNGEGNVLGPCLGQVVPGHETCGAAGDEDCNGSANDHCAVWARIFGSGSDQQATTIGVDAANNVFAAGYVIGSANFDGTLVSSAGNKDVFLAKLGPGGSVLWAKGGFGDAGIQEALGLAVDANGDVFVTGVFSGTISFGAPTALLTSAGLSDVFVAKFSALGAPLWSRRFGDALDQAGRAIAVDPSGDIIVTGDFAGSIDFDGGPLASVELKDGFIAKLTSAGDHVWSMQFGNTGDDSALGVACSATGHVHVTGTFDEAIDFGGPPLTDGGDNDTFVVKLDSGGGHVWSKAFGGLLDQGGASIAVDASGNVILSGAYEGSINFGGGVLPSFGGVDIFVAKLSAAGVHLWSHGFGGASEDVGHTVAVDSAGNVVASGWFSGTVNFGEGPLASLGPNEIFLIKFTPAGALLWSRSFGDAGDQDVRAVTTDSTGHILLAGDVGGTTNFGTGPLISAGQDDLLIAKIAP